MTARHLPYLRAFPVPQAMQFALGLGALWVGAWVYATRITHPDVLFAFSVPSFLHVLAMALLTAAFAPPTRRGALVLCAAWVAINWLFESGQHAGLAKPIYQWLQAQCGEWPACHRSALFFRNGTFDTLDLVAAAAGGVCAWLLLWSSARRTWSRA